MDGKQSVPHTLLCNQMCVNKLKAPRSQALEKLTCFASLAAPLTCLHHGTPLPQAPIISGNVAYHGTHFEKHACGHFGQ